MSNYIYDKHRCILKNCMKEQQDAIQKQELFSNMITDVLQKYEQKKITPVQFNRKFKQIFKTIWTISTF